MESEIWCGDGSLTACEFYIKYFCRVFKITDMATMRNIDLMWADFNTNFRVVRIYTSGNYKQKWIINSILRSIHYSFIATVH
jgi:hypothetical protein